MSRKSEGKASLLWLGLALFGAALLWWAVRRRITWKVTTLPKPEPELLSPTAMVLTPVEETGPVEEAEPIPAPPLPPKPNDFKVIKGIGPTIDRILHAEGLNTFEELAVTEVSRLVQILNDADIPLADPGTWPQQAALAAAGDWESLAALQSQLQRGRRV